MTINLFRGVGLAMVLATAACTLVPTSSARADLYGHWPLDDGEGFEARNEANEEAPGFIFDADSFDSLGGTEDEPSVWVNDPNKPGTEDGGIVLGLNGQTQWVEAGFIKMMDLENDHTWAFWGRLPPEQASPNNDIVLGSRFGENGSDTSPREFIKFTPNRFEYHMNGGFGDDLAYADSNLPQEQWVYNSVVKDGNSLSYFRNGEFRNSTTISGGQTSGEQLFVGFGGDVLSNGGEAWRGSLSDVQMYTSALTPAQIAIAITGEVVGDAELFAHYPLNDGGESDVVIGTGPGAREDGAFIDNIDAGLGVDGLVWVDDPERGTVLSLAGTFVDAADLPLMDLENDFSWNFWSKSDSGQAQTDGSVIIGNGSGNAEFIRFTNNRIEFRADGTDASDLEWGMAGPDDNRIPNDDQWYHHVVVKDGDKMTYYRNGQARNEVSLGLGQQSPDPMPFAMGGQAAPDSAGNETPIVYLSDVRLYDNALTGAEVAELAGVAVADTCESLAASRIAGDADGDGEVAFGDFLALANGFGTDAGYEGGDFNCDGEVAFGDFLTLANNFGATAAASSVPEPSSTLMFASAFICVGLLRRRRS